MKKLLLLITFIYFLIATLTYHPDNKLVLTWASLDHGTVWNVWKADTQALAGVGQSNYPPLHFIIDKLQYFISIPFAGPGYYEWLSNDPDFNFDPTSLTRYAFAIKMPLILFAIASGYIIYLIAKLNSFTEKQSTLATLIWFLNPITIYSIPIMGQNDIMPITAFLLGWYLLHKKKLVYSTLAFGAATAIKMFPIIWLPFLLCYETTISVKNRFKIILGTLVVYFLTLLPFLSNSVFRENVFSTGIDRFFVSRIDLGYEDFVLIVPLLIMIIIYGLILKVTTTNKNNTFFRQSSVLLLFNMVFLFFNHFNPQWFLWLVPFWIFWFMYQKSNKLYILLATLGCISSWILVIFLIRDSALTLGLLTPLNYSLDTILPIRTLLETKDVHVTLYNNYAHTFLASCAIIFLLYWFKSSEKSPQPFNIKNLFNPIKFSKKILYVGSVFLAMLTIFSVSSFSHLIPILPNDQKPRIKEYPIIYSSITKEFVAQQEMLTRVDLFLSDNTLENFDDYSLIMKDENGVIVGSQTFNGLNVGYRTSIQFKFLPVPNSKDKTFILEIIAPETSEIPLRVASTTSSNLDTVIQGYYAKPTGIKLAKYVTKHGYESSLNVIEQNKILYILMLMLLWFAL
jgi:hypothetical protein